MDDEYVYVDENHRLGWGYDESPDNPRENWDIWVSGFVTIESRPRVYDVTPVHSDPTGRITEAHERFTNIIAKRSDYRYNAGRGFNADAAEITERWARIFHNLYVEWDAEYQGYWFIDPDKYRDNWPNGDGPDGAEIVKEERKTYSDWAEGSVYYVFAEERKVEHVTVTDPLTGKVLREYDREIWDRTDSLYDVYMDDANYGPTFEHMVKAVARDNFPAEYTAAS